MSKRIVLLLSPFILSFVMIVLVITAVATPITHAAKSVNTTHKTPLFTGIKENGALGSNLLGHFGPYICTAWGDPYSPLNSQWNQDYPYTYQYRIRIPADYPDDTLRIELFDPDSINQPGETFSITHSTIATTYSFSDTLVPRVCEGYMANQKNICIFETGEVTLTTAYPDIHPDQINERWYIRVDENRGQNIAGICRNYFYYSPQTNTETLFQLYYLQEEEHEAINRVDLAAYTGQVGDGNRDIGEHDTDLRWVSPGGTLAFDQAVSVPVDPGSTKSFELNLAVDVPGIQVDPITEDKFIYLDVTSLTGGSANNFHIWAGPNDYIDIVSSNVNERQLTLANHPDILNSHGVTIEALDSLYRESHTWDYVDIPLVKINPEQMGQTISLTIFDPDAGSRPPIVFYFDSLAFTADESTDNIDEANTDWAVSFGGEVDLEGRCFDGGVDYLYDCQDIWISPTYQIQIPGNLAQCDLSQPNQVDCTPFYGGRLMARFLQGFGDNHVFEVDLPETPAGDNSLSCSAFPTLVDEGSRSVQPPEAVNNAFPSGDFAYPAQEPIYGSYVLRHHQPDVVLTQAEPGALYKVALGTGPASYRWAVWNQFVENSAATLATSLMWSGNSFDYTTLVNGRFPGYQEPDNPSDQTLQLDNWVLANSTLTDDEAILTVLNNHIDLQRLLHLPVASQSYEVEGDTHAQISRFGLFRILGYNLNPADDAPWLLLEFQRWDDSCGQQADAPVALDSVTIQPAPEIVGNVVTVTAVTTPSSATRPITYTWQTISEIITHTTGFTDTANFTLLYSSTQTITVTTTNGVGQPVTDTITITTEPLRIFLPLIMQPDIEPKTAVHHTSHISTLKQLHINARKTAVHPKAPLPKAP